MDACIPHGTLLEPRRRSRRTRIRLSIQLFPLLTVAACLEHLAPELVMPKTFVMITGGGQVGEVGTELSQSIIVALTDIYGAPVKGIEVRFTGTGETLRSQTMTDDNGRASTHWKLGSQVGPQLLRVTAPNAWELTVSAMAVAGPPVAISIVSSAAQFVAPGAQLDTLMVAVADRFGNRVVGAPVNWSVVLGGGSVTPVNANTDAQGRARAVCTLGPSPGSHRLLVTSGTASRQFDATTGTLFTAVQVVAGFDHACALNSDEVTFCWGTNWSGQLGHGTADQQSNPNPIPITGPRFKVLVAGSSHTCGLTNDGATFCWGRNWAGQTGSLSSDTPTPTRVFGAPAFVALVAGWVHTCGLTSDGRVYCWGDDSYGQLGRGNERSAAVPAWSFRHADPALVSGGLRFTSISSAPHATNTCGLAGGVAYCWGENPEGALGSVIQQKCTVLVDDYYYYPIEYKVPCSTVPLQVPTSGAATSVVHVRYGACTILNTQELECWGQGFSPSPVPDSRVTRAWGLSATICGEADTGEVKCWRAVRPYNVVDPFGTAGALVDLHSSGRISCGISKATSVVYCWGSNYFGALGDGTSLHRETPGPVVSRP